MAVKARAARYSNCMNKNTTSTEGSSAEEAEPSAGADEQTGTGTAESKAESTEDGNPTDGLPEKMAVDENLDPPDLDQAKADAAGDKSKDGEGDAAEDKTGEKAEAGSDTEDQSAEPSEAEEEPDEELTPEQQVVALQEQLSTQQAGFKDDLLRMQAEMQNQRKRLEAQSERSRKFALEGFAKELLEVKDSLEMGLEAAQQEGAELANFVEGADLTLKKLSQSFDKHNITEINPMDEKFNPELHEAMSQAPVEGKEPNTVIGVIQKGYTLNGRVIRAARVMVAK